MWQARLSRILTDGVLVDLSHTDGRLSSVFIEASEIATRQDLIDRVKAHVGTLTAVDTRVSGLKTSLASLVGRTIPLD